MMRRLVGAFAFTCMLSTVVAPGVAGDSARNLPMQFAMRQEGPSANCRDKCRVWVSATGMIKSDTAREFEAFAEKNNIRGLTIALDSEGGSVLGAIALGRSIRRLDMTTTVGRTSEVPVGKGEAPRALLSPRADCESMCAFVLLGGTKRVVPAEARVRVHQIWLGDRREDANAATYSAEDLVLVQRDIGKLAQYTIEMGGAMELLETSLRIPPWEPMRSLTRDELRRMRLDLAEAVREQPAPSADPIQAASPNLHRISTKTDRGWTMLEQAGTTVLARNHPLTVEGEVIGTFNVMLTCGARPNEFGLVYSETRRIRGGDSSPDALKDVAVSVGARTAALNISPSDTRTHQSQRTTTATGVIPVGAMRSFADVSSRSLTVATLSANNTETSIRVGNTGVAQHFPQFAAACAKQIPTTHAELTSQQVK